MVGWQFPSFLRHIHSADEIGVKDPDPAIPHLTHIIFVGGCETSRVPVSFFKYRSRSASRGTWDAELESVMGHQTSEQGSLLGCNAALQSLDWDPRLLLYLILYLCHFVTFVLGHLSFPLLLSCAFSP